MVNYPLEVNMQGLNIAIESAGNQYDRFVIPTSWQECSVDMDTTAKATERSKVYKTLHGRYYERTQIDLRTAKENTPLTAHVGYWGDLPPDWQSKLSNHIDLMYGPKENGGHGYIDLSHETYTRNKEDDLIAWVNDGKGNIIAHIGTEARKSGNETLFFDLGIRKDKGEESDRFSTMSFLDNVFDPDIMERLGYDLDEIESMKSESTHEITRFVVPPKFLGKEHIQKRIASLTGVLLLLTSAINRHNNYLPDQPKINWLIGNIDYNGGVKKYLDKALPNIKYVTTKTTYAPSRILGRTQLKISDNALNTNHPFGYASQYMSKYRPKYEDNGVVPKLNRHNEAMGLAGFISKVDNLDELLNNYREELNTLSNNFRFILRKALPFAVGNILKRLFSAA